MDFGITEHKTSSGKPYKFARSAMRSHAFKQCSSARIVELDDGFVVLTGKAMTKDEALLFREHYIPYRNQNMLHAEAFLKKTENLGQLSNLFYVAKTVRLRKFLGFIIGKCHLMKLVKKLSIVICHIKHGNVVE